MGSLASSNSKDDEDNSKKKESQEDSSYDYELKVDKKYLVNKNKNYSITEQSDTAENSKIIDLKEKSISYKFEWKEGGTEVKMAASFLNYWGEKVNLKKNPSSGIFEIVLNVPKAVHQFKFIVDKKWVCSSYYKTIKERNNTNNIIDLTNYNPNEKYDVDESLNSTDNKKKKKKVKKNNQDYNCNYPKLNTINDDAPAIPFLYINNFDLNNQTQQMKLKNRFDKYLKINTSRNKLESTTFKTIIAINHEKVLYICYDIESNNERNRFIKTAITQRNKHKFLTIIYYSPKS